MVDVDRRILRVAGFRAFMRGLQWESNLTYQMDTIVRTVVTPDDEERKAQN